MNFKRNKTGSAIMLVFGMLALLRFHETAMWFFLLQALRDLLAAYFLWTRAPAEREAQKLFAVLAYVSSALPLFYFRAAGASAPLLTMTSEMLVATGFLIATFATIELGNRLGVSPAKRGEVCSSGIYRFLNHPMYVGYIVAECGVVLLNHQNAGLFAVSVLLYTFRARAERRLLGRPSIVDMEQGAQVR